MVIAVREYSNGKLIDKSFFTGEYDSQGVPVTTDIKQQAKVYSSAVADTVAKQVTKDLAKVKTGNISHIAFPEN